MWAHPVVATAARTEAAVATSSSEPTLLDVVVAVDESASLTDDDVRREIEATRYIALGSSLNPASRVAVIGFGSENEPGRPAVDVACPPSVVGAPEERGAIVRCAGKLHRRTAAEGSDTDHATALTQAVSYFDSSSLENAQRMVFLMTDGVLDVHGSARYGEVEADRNDMAKGIVKERLDQAARLGVQVWPLGFGSADEEQLQTFAAGASSTSCSDQTGPPRARVIRDPADLQSAVLDAFHRATCMSSEEPPPEPVGPGTSTNIAVTVPMIATDGMILVSKGDRRVAVTYLDPNGKQVPTQGESGGSTFSLSGQDSETEALRITKLRPGRYTVHIEAGEDLQSQLVRVVALWQGAVRAVLFTSPAVATPGQKVVVHVRLRSRSRSGSIRSPDALKGIAVSVSVGAPGSTAAPATTVPMHDDGRGDDPAADDGQFSGSFDASDSVGRQQLTAVVTGAGIHAEPLVETLAVQPVSALVLAALSFDLPTKVVTGESVHGQISVTNNTSAPVPATLELRDDAGLVSLQGPQTLTLPRGRSTHDVRLTTSEGGPTGPLDAQVLLVSTNDPTITYGRQELRTRISGPPSLWERFFWGFLAAGCVVAALLVFLGLRWFARLRRRRVQGLLVEIVDPPQGRAVRSWRAPPGWARTMRFVIQPQADSSSVNPPRLMGPSASHGTRYAVSRRRDGKVRVSVGGRTSDLVLGRETLALENSRYVLRIVEPGSGSSTATPYSGGGWGGTVETFAENPYLN